ncbi:MAG: diguanylate cyclase [Nitrospinota bacterium]|nr:diguanylate cyclase [Nitrospinota bacterium]
MPSYEMDNKKLKILIAEDDSDDIVLTMELLRQVFGRGVGVIDHAESYNITIDLLKQTQYDVCLFDYQPGELSGIELLRELRRNGNNTPIIFLTGQGDQEVAVEAMKSGATDYLSKTNLTHEMLGQSIRHAMESFQKEEERRQAQKALEEATRQRELILNAAGEGIFSMDSEGNITFTNPSASMMLGYSPESLIGKNVHDTIHHSRPDGSSFPKEQCPHYTTLTNGVLQHITDDIFWRHDKTSFPVEYTSSPIMESNEIVGAVITFRDITERKRSDEMIRDMAYHDGLTGLPNRILLYDRINLALTHAQRYKEMLAILFVDLDDFKPVNDNLGHAVGDLVLQKVAQRLKGCLREGDTVARLGGDEFVVLLNQISNRQDASKTAQKLLDSIQPEFVLGPHKVSLSVSVGVSLYPKDGKSRDTLLKNADLALYRAKQKEKNCFELHSPD